MRRIRPATIVSSFCRATIAAPFSTANPKPKPHTKPPSDIFGGFVRNQLQSEERARKALGIWFRDYGGGSIILTDEEKVNLRKVSFSQKDFNAFVTNLEDECGSDYEKFHIVCEEFNKVLKKMTREDRLAEIAAEEELDAFITNLFVTNLMIECEPKYEKRFREIIEKVRKKMIQDDGILKAFELATNLMSKCEPEYEKLHCEVHEKVCEKITHQDDKGENENLRKIENLAKLDMKVRDIYSFEEQLDEFVTGTFLKNLRDVEEMKPYFMAYEVIEKVAEKVGNENLRKLAEKKLDAIVTDSFVSDTVDVQTNIPYFKFLRPGMSLRDYGGRATQDDDLDEEKVAKTNVPKFSEEELDVFLTNLAIECETDHEKYEIVRKEFHEVIEKMTQDELGDASQNDRVDKLAEIAEEELDAFVTNSFTTKLMIECDPKYGKRFREIIEKVRKKMIRYDGILEAFKLVTNLMSKCELEYEKLLCEVLEKVREKITHQDDKGEDENKRKIEKLSKLDMKVGDIHSFEEELDEFVTGIFLKNLRDVEEMKPCFMAYEVIEKVAKKVGNENLRKIAEKKLDALVTDSFLSETVVVQTHIPHFKFLTWKLGRKWKHEDEDAFDGGKEVGGQLEGRKSELS